MFSLPSTPINKNSWGPTQVHVPTRYTEIPFAPFNKAERLGRACDWYNLKNARFGQKFGATNAAFDFTWDENEGFELVDYDSAKNRFHTGRRWQRSNWHHRRNQNDRNRYKQSDRRWKKHNKPVVSKKKRWRFYPAYQSKQERIRVASIDIQSTWNLKEEVDLKYLEKAKHFIDENPKTLLKCGSLLMYDKAYDRVTTKNERALDKTDLAFPKVTTSDDPNIRDLAAKKQGTVFATDAILAVLMSCPRSIYPWDVVANRVGNQLFFDKRDGSTFDYITVGETALNPPEEDNVGDAINQKDSLSKEATLVNQAFSVQVLDRAQKPLKFEQPDPFAEGDDSAAVCPKGYLYRQWDLEDGNVLVARCDLDGYAKGVRGADETLTINALNEYDPKVSMDWRRTIDAQGGAVLAAELKANANKLAQWTVRAILGGAEKMVFGFVSRARMNSNQAHSILATQSYKTSEFARQISLRTANMWGILKELVDRLMAQPEGRYVLLRDPNKASVRIFKVPADAFDAPRPSEDDTLNME